MRKKHKAVWLQLLGRDCTPSAITKHITVLQKYFRNHHKPQACPGDTSMVGSFLANRCNYQQIIQEQEKDFSFDSCQGDGLLPLQEWQKSCRPTSTHCFCSGQVSERWIIVDADVCDAWLGLLHSAPKRKLSTSDSKMSSRSSTSHAAPQVGRGEADNGAAARCEHMAC